MNWPIVSDISNYDYDEDTDEPTWPGQFLAAGISGIIVGSQWPYKAAAQIEQARAQGLRVIGTYAEPDTESAIALAKSCGAGFVGLACERGSILTYAEILADVRAVRAAGLTPWLYGNAGDLVSICGPLLYQELVWLANYGANDPANPRSPITEMNFGSGVVKLAAHQFSSTIVVAGRNRDHSYLYMEEEMPDPRVDALISDIAALKRAVFAGSEQPGDEATRLDYANFKIGEGGQSVNDRAASALAIALKAHGEDVVGLTEADVQRIAAQVLSGARIVPGG